MEEIGKKYKITVDSEIIERLHAKMELLESVREIRNLIEKVFATIAFENYHEVKKAALHKSKGGEQVKIFDYDKKCK